MRKRTKRTQPGRYYEQAPSGLHEVEDPQFTPSVVLCRRVSDYPEGRPPAHAEQTMCGSCFEDVAFDPAGPHRDVPKLCLQCFGIHPLPMEA